MSSRPASPDTLLADTPASALPEADGSVEMLVSDLSRRGFLKGAALAGGGLMAATLAACAPAATPGWTVTPISSDSPSGAPGGSATPPSATPPPATASPAPTASTSPSPAPSASIPPGYSSHDVEARQVVRRYLGDLVPALRDIYGEDAFARLADILAAADGYPELGQKPAFVQVPQLVLNDILAPLRPELDGDTKVFRLTIDKIDQRIDELKAPIAALGFNGQWPGPTIRVNQGDRVRAVFMNNLDESTGIHFHGVEFDDFFADGVPFVTQKPIVPGETYTYEFVARTAGSLMYHSHHNATDQVGRGLLGAFIVDPPNDPYKADRDHIWISNDALGGFTINGHGFPAVVPVLAAVGETVRIRFMNEGVMMHPWHSHGYTMRIVTRDGHDLGSAAFDCDTLGVNPGERYDALITADRPGVWAFHCHVLPHVEGLSGMFGMVSTLIVVPKKEHVDAIVAALVA
jgi:FtsP/CotA-like multicopper oxidase with cupredoxin domain